MINNEWHQKIEKVVPFLLGNGGIHFYGEKIMSQKEIGDTLVNLRFPQVRAQVILHPHNERDTTDTTDTTMHTHTDCRCSDDML